MDKTNIVILCAKHHEEVTTGGYQDVLKDGFYVVTNKRGQVVVKKRWDVSEDPPGGKENDGIRAKDECEETASAHLPLEVGGRRDRRPESLRGLDSDSAARDASRVLPTMPEVRRDTEADFDSWREEGQRIALAWQSQHGNETSLAWVTGDHFLEGERWQESSQEYGTFPLKKRTIGNYISVAERFRPDRRRWPLPFTHYQDAAYITNREDQEEVLDEAVEKGWTRNQLRVAIHGPKQKPRYRCKNCGEEGEISDFERVKV